MMGRASSNTKSTKSNRSLSNGEPVGDEDDDEEQVPLRRTTRLRQRTDQKSLTEAIEKKVETPTAPPPQPLPPTAAPPKPEIKKEKEVKKVPKKVKPAPKVETDVCTSVTRRSQRKINNVSKDIEKFEPEVKWEEQDLFDCCFIKVTGKVYNRWKEVKRKLKFSRDEELVIYLLDHQAEDSNPEKQQSNEPIAEDDAAEVESHQKADEKIEINSPKIETETPKENGSLPIEEFGVARPIKDEIFYRESTPESSSEKHSSPASNVTDTQIATRPKTDLSKKQIIRRRKEAALNSRNDSEEEDSAEKSIKRRKIRYDCRKTPTGGIPVKTNFETLNDDKETGSDSSSPLQPTSHLDENWCRNCDIRHPEGRVEGCPLYNPMYIVTDAVIDFSSSNRDINRDSSRLEDSSLSNKDLSKCFAQLSLPTVLELAPLPDESEEQKSNLIVISKTQIKALTQFGPLQGEMILERDIPDDFNMKDLWQIFTKDSSRIYMKTTNPEKSNWFRYVRPAQTRRLRNVATLVKDDQLFLVTTTDLEPGDELVYWMDDPLLMWSKTRADKKNCGGCNLQFSHPLYYRMHCAIFHDPQFSLTIRKYHCKVCGTAVLGKENIVKHAASQHGGRGAYQCQYCKKFFLRLNYLEMHRTYGCSSNPSRTRPLCDLCGKKFCQPQKLKVHMKRMHGDDGDEGLVDFKCPICDKMFATRHAVLRHQKEVHADMLDNSNHSDLIRTDSDLVDHSRESSTEAKRLTTTVPPKVACPKCPKTFKNKSNLKIHMLTHSGVKPFGCKIEGCRNGFTTKQCLQFHYRKSHGLSDEEMPKIEREIPYTLSAYSGELTDHRIFKKKSANNTGTQGSSKRDSFRKLPKCEIIDRDSLDRDVYEFQDNDEEERVEKCVKKDEELLAVTDKTSLLVVAALCAAEQDLKTSGILPDSKDDTSESPKDEEDKGLIPYLSPPECKDEDLEQESSVPDEIQNQDPEGFPDPDFNPSDPVNQNDIPIATDEPPPPVPTPQQLEPIPQPEPVQSQTGYDGYLTGGVQSSSPFRRSPGPFAGSNLFQSSSSSSMMHSSSSSVPRDSGNYPQHFPFSPPGAHGSAGHIYHPGLDIASRYTSHFRGSTDYPPPSLPYARNAYPHPSADFSISTSATPESFYGDSTGGSIDLSSHGSGNSPVAPPSVPTSSSLFSHHASMMMMNEHLLTSHNGARGDTPPPPTSDILGPFSRGISKDPDGVRYHPHPHGQNYYSHHVSNPSGRFPPSPGPYHPPSTRIPHLGQSGPSPYHYGYF